MNWLKKLFQNAITREEVDAKIKAAIAVQWISSIQKLDIKDGDALFVRYPHARYLRRNMSI
jgi:hypothetical protein